MNRPGKLIIATLAAVFAGFLIQVIIPFTSNDAHGSGPYLTTENPLVLKGQEVYHQEGCFYCHTRKLRPFEWEVKRFSDQEKLGFFPLIDPVEFQFHSPGTVSSTRIGPDLSRVGTKMSQEELRSILDHKPSADDSLAERYHKYGELFSDEFSEWDGIALSWKIRGMLQSGLYINDPYQRAVFMSMEGQTRGDALVQYLMSLGKDKADFAGKFYQ